MSVTAALGAPGLPGSRSSAARGTGRTAPLTLVNPATSANAYSSSGSGGSSNSSSSSSRLSAMRNFSPRLGKGLRKTSTRLDETMLELETQVENLLTAGGRPSEIAEAFAELGDAQLQQGALPQALESFAFALSYSSPRAQAVAYLGVAKTRYAMAKKLSKTKRAKTREEALQDIEAALKLVARFHQDTPLETEAKQLHNVVQALPFKVSV
ncbi:Hypothetical Protein FCC1311_045482 [Hondaea fermentalgiana]|uniref:Uncharacterized protein n=1 Tax=Hondaea fermentalgiana TaxID=2315210 RepID=A0A2R5GCP5_9STRA|nr:Hypothetical Protein FCC1311_045482 [Hondaea fermentalgiana]|eukprot:GBG28325.1 Hypothetical Protein FCC1311_045482 [Hondaea fermentalgiana]